MLPWLDIQTQIERYVERRILTESVFLERKKNCLRWLRGELTDHWQTWKQRAEEAHKQHLVPDFDEPPSATYPVESDPPPSVIAATDGSQIFPSRHEIAPMALINTGRIRIDYVHFQNPPLMDSVAQILLWEDFEEWVEPGREPAFKDLVSDRRDLEEISALAAILCDHEVESGEAIQIPRLALTDGSLLKWQLAGRMEEQYENRVLEQYIASLDRFRRAQIPVAGYISNSGSREVVNLVQWVESQQSGMDGVATDTVSPRSAGLTDAALLRELLDDGERSTLFHSRSKIVKAYGVHRISFFYLNLGEEIAKVEIPQWVAKDRAQVDRVAALCRRQARLGGGYPIILSEAHEQAVVRGPDRDAFYALVEQSLLRRGIRPSLSAKQLRKRVAIL